LGVWFGVGGTDMESGSPLDRAFLSGILCLGLLILAKRKFNWSNAIKENPWLMLLIGYMLLSIFWSDIPYTSFKRWIRQMVAVVMVFLVATEPEPRQALQCLFRRTIYILIPHLGVTYGHWSGALMWIGVSTQKNGLSRLCFFAVFFLIWTLIRRWQGRDIPVVKYQTYIEIFILLLTIWLFTGPQHTLTYSATSTAALAVGLMAFVCLLWMKKRGRLIGASTWMVIIVIFLVYGAITPFVGGLTLFDVSTTLGREETLTGRTDIWAVLVPYAMQKPIFGHGFGGFWTDEIRNISSSNAHNGSLDLILSLGFVGVILFSIFLLSCCRKAQREMSRDFDWGVFWICFLLMALVHNIAESTITSFTNYMVAVLLLFDISSNAGSSNADVDRQEKP